MQYEIVIIPSHKIDRFKWDQCISKSLNGLIYATTDYLDHTTDNWTGIVVNEYDAVMPVAWRIKHGIKYAYDVPFIQQLGVFSTDANIPLIDFISAMFSICRYGDYNFNSAFGVLHAVNRTNFILPLHSAYENLAKDFSSGVRLDIKRSQDNGFKYLSGSIDESVDIYHQLYGERIKHVTKYQFENFKRLCILLQGQGRLVTRKIIDNNGAIQSNILLLKYKRRLYNIMNSTPPPGRENKANYFLLSSLWKEFQQTDLLFDFEGSDVPGIKTFYKKFGAVNQSYYSLHFNNLPGLLRLLKR